MNNDSATNAGDIENDTDHAVIVLASGLSRRLGQSKQLLKKNNVPLITYMTKLALATQPQAVIIVIPNKPFAITESIDKLISDLLGPQHLQASYLQTVINPTPESGMGHSLFLGVDALNNISCHDELSIKRILIMGIDQVLLDHTHLDKLLESDHLVAASSYAPINPIDSSFSSEMANTKPVITGLPIVIDIALLQRWQPMLRGDKGLRYLIRDLSDKQLRQVINTKLSYDVDTVEQFSHAKQQGWLDN